MPTVKVNSKGRTYEIDIDPDPGYTTKDVVNLIENDHAACICITWMSRLPDAHAAVYMVYQQDEYAEEWHGTAPVGAPNPNKRIALLHKVTPGPSLPFNMNVFRKSILPPIDTSVELDRSVATDKPVRVVDAEEK